MGLLPLLLGCLLAAASAPGPAPPLPPALPPPPARDDGAAAVRCGTAAAPQDLRLWCRRYGPPSWAAAMRGGGALTSNWTESQAERCPSGGVVILHRFCGRTGNRFLQYTFARLLAEELGFGLLTPSIGRWGHTTLLLPRRLVPTTTQWDIDPQLGLGMGTLHLYQRLAADCRPRCVELSGSFARYEYLRPHRARVRRWFPPTTVPGPTEVIVVHVRADDIRSNVNLNVRDGRHVMLPYWYYHEVLRRTAWRSVLLVTDSKADPVVRRLQRTFRAAVGGADVFRDFQTMRGAAQLVLSASSLSWFAAVLGNASAVHYPHVGHFHLNNTGGNAFVVDDDPRWVYHDLPHRRFFLRHRELLALYSSPPA